MDRRVGTNLNSRFDVSVVRVEDSHSRLGQLTMDPGLKGLTQIAQLCTGIDPAHDIGVRGDQGFHKMALLGEQRDRIGQVVLALGIRRRDLTQCCKEE